MAEGINLEDSGIRLSVYQKTRIDYIKDSVPKPAGYLPPKSLPTWEALALEQKLPLLPAPPGALYFSRGHLGKTLLRQNLDYSLVDPLNRERIPSEKYEVLHDKTARLHENAHAREFFKTHGAVNEKGEVICTLKEFNRYRTYLATLYNDRVRKKVEELDHLKEMERAAAREFNREALLVQGQGREAIRTEKIAKAKRFLEEKEEAKRAKYREKVKVEAQRLVDLEVMRRRQQAEKVTGEESKRRITGQRRLDKKGKEVEWRKEVLHKMTLKDMQSAAYREHHDREKKIVAEKEVAEWFDAKLLSAAERLQRENVIREEYVEELRRKAGRRQKNVERFRAELPMRIAKRLAKEKRLDDIVRKYAMRWLNRVRERLNRPVDETHESLWYSQFKNSLSEGVKYLYQASGHEKLDDVVMNILKFKEALKKQLLMEDDDEDDEDEEDE